MHVMKQTIGYAGMDKSHKALTLQLESTSSTTSSSQRASITLTTSQQQSSTSSVALHASVGYVKSSSISSCRSESSNMSTISQQLVKIGQERGSQTQRKRTPLTPDTAGKDCHSSRHPLEPVAPDRHRLSWHSVEAKRRGNARKSCVPLTHGTTRAG
jgi:hypothetical protein